MRFAGPVRVAVLLLTIVGGFFVSMRMGAEAYWFFMIGVLVIYILAVWVSAALFPLEVNRQ